MNAKTRRSTQACDNCSRRRVRCRSGPSQQCQNCADYGEQCTYKRPQRKRGAKERRPRSSSKGESTSLTPSNNLRDSDVALPQNHDAPVDDKSHSPGAKTNAAVTHPLDGTCWAPPVTISQSLAFDLVEVYVEVVYPVFPLFRMDVLRRRVSRGEHAKDRPFYASVMAMCALSSARARDGAVYAHTADRQDIANPPSESLFDAAFSALELKPSENPCLDYMRAAVLLSITAIQYGNARAMSFFLGIYHTYVAAGGLHDEDNWPQNLSHVEVQERRRLFWSAYTLDVFTSIVFNGVVRSRELSSNVSYPEPIEDEIPGKRTNSSVHWLAGWNFVTDLYRILEHAVDHLHRLRNPPRRTPAVFGALDERSSGVFSGTNVIARVVQMYTELPESLRAIQPTSGDLSEDLFGFQFANIQATVQLVRMVYLINDNATLSEKCDVASEVITGFRVIPVDYLRAISTPLQHHLGEIGAILGAACKGGMTKSSYRLVRDVLGELVQLIETLESGLYFPTGTGNKIREQIARLDDFMASGRPADVLGVENMDTGAAIDSADWSPFFHFPPELLEDWFAPLRSSTYA